MLNRPVGEKEEKIKSKEKQVSILPQVLLATFENPTFVLVQASGRRMVYGFRLICSVKKRKRHNAQKVASLPRGGLRSKKNQPLRKKSIATPPPQGGGWNDH